MNIRMLSLVTTAALAGCHPRYGFDIENHTAAAVRVSAAGHGRHFAAFESDIAPGGRLRWRGDVGGGWTIALGSDPAASRPTLGFQVTHSRPCVFVVREVDDMLTLEPAILDSLQ